MTLDIVEGFFARYEQFFAQSLAGKMDGNEISSLYAQEFIAASPLGVLAGKNDPAFQQALAQGYVQYRKIGTKDMRVRKVDISPIDELHCVAHVAWTATYTTPHSPYISIDFDVHYLLQQLGSGPRIFGWVAGDEQEVLKQHGVI